MRHGAIVEDELGALRGGGGVEPGPQIGRHGAPSHRGDMAAAESEQVVAATDADLQHRIDGMAGGLPNRAKAVPCLPAEADGRLDAAHARALIQVEGGESRHPRISGILPCRAQGGLKGLDVGVVARAGSEEEVGHGPPPSRGPL